MKDDLQVIIDETKDIRRRVDLLIRGTNSYDLQRQLKKVDAELIDVLHNLAITLEMCQQ